MNLFKNIYPFSFLFFITINISCTGVSSDDSAKISEKNDKKTDVKEPNVKNQDVKEPDKVVQNAVVILTVQNFYEEIKSGVSVVDFWAAWCRPCHKQSPIIEEVNSEIKGKAKICKIDVDKAPDIADRYGIQSIPTIIIFKNGKVVEQFVGITSKEVLLAAIQKQL